MTPLYGFLRGDTLGLLVLADDADTADELAARLVSAASVRVRALRHPRVVFQGVRLASTATVAGAGMTALDRFDVVDGEE